MKNLKTSLEQFLKSADDKILKRGKECYENGCIKKLTDNKNSFSAQVCGSNGELYNLTIKLDEQGNIDEYDCASNLTYQHETRFYSRL